MSPMKYLIKIMRSYTDIEQSKKLAEILPLENADMSYVLDIDKWKYHVDLGKFSYWIVPKYAETKMPRILPCWSLAALLDILRNWAPSIDEDANVSLFSYRTVEWWDLTICNSVIEPVTKSDPIDACVEMIYTLKNKDLI